MLRHCRPGEAIVWRSVTADRSVIGRAWPMTIVRDDDDLIAAYLRPGSVFRMSTRMTRPSELQYVLRSDERHHDAVWRGTDALILYRPGAAHSVWRFQRADDQTLKIWYVNLEDPWTRTSIGFDSRDHELDVVVAPDLSSWFWKDEDEIEKETAEGRVTPADVAAHRAEGERAARRIMPREPPFDEDWTAWRPDPAWAVPVLPPGWDAFDPAS